MNAERNENRNDSHLPECIYAPEKFDTEQNIVWGSKPCICDALRACEQRVRLEDDDYSYVAAQAEAYGRRRGWNEALDAAREAVAGLRTYGDHGEVIPPDEEAAVIYVTDALAAIDALKETNVNA